MQKTFPTLNAIKLWAHSNNLSFFDVDMPYIQKDEQFYYFGMDENGKGFNLLMTSSQDLGAQA